MRAFVTQRLIGVAFLLAILLAAGVEQVRSQEQTSKPVDFATEIQPILVRNCQTCHQGGAAPADLKLDSAEALMKGSISGRVVVPGKSADSLMVQRINGKDGIIMPPVGSPLSKSDIALITAWIDQGAKTPQNIISHQAAPKHWAYLKPLRPAVPEVRNTNWVRNEIDRFVLARLEKEGIQPSPEASKETLIRRVSLDLIGLPPSPAEVDAFVKDARPDAYEQLVDRLLASPKYGERWATPWLDLARYGDSDGLRDDHQRVSWPYRDWVINALNKNMPFDQFTIEQLAGDMLPNATQEQKIATGFVRSSTLQTEGGTDPEENNWNAQIDRTTTVGTAWLGSSVGCAQCHNHKYDPFTQKQFYQMVAFFNNVQFVDQPRRKGSGTAFSNSKQYTEPKIDLPTPEQAQKRDEINRELSQYQKKLTENSPDFQKRQADWAEKAVAFEKEWQPLRPTRLVSTGGSTLTLADDGSILASGKNPDFDTYIVEGPSVMQEVTGIRIEAIPHAGLPGGGPGRDYYGNFVVRELTVEAGSSAQNLSKVAIKEMLPDEAMPNLLDAHAKMKQTWIVDATRNLMAYQNGTLPEKDKETGGRVRYQFLLIPEKPIRLGPGGILRVSIEHHSEVGGVGLGNFRIGVTGSANPKEALAVRASLRPILSIPQQDRSSEQTQSLIDYYRTVDDVLAPTRQKIAELRKKLDDLQIPSALVMAEDVSVDHPSTFVRMRGAFVSKGDQVDADVPAFLGALPKNTPANRLAFARWLVSRDNPLSARVRINQIWETMFGRGIVETTEDFGTQGVPPSHPEMLDWLSVQFMDSGWDTKAIQRLIVTSTMYRQSSAVTKDLLERDPNNVLLARAPRFRVEAEMVRDISLSAGGMLSSKMFGPPVKPYEPAGLWTWIENEKSDWIMSAGDDRYRRALYTFNRRSVRYPSLTVFDAPNREVCIARRNHSDTPLQALTTLNDPTFFEAAQAMAHRVLTEGGLNEEARVTYAFRLATARAPQPKEMDTLLSGLEKSKQTYQRNLKEAEEVAGKPDAELAAWTMFSNAILNLDETITRH
jgi:hypothetical protein